MRSSILIFETGIAKELHRDDLRALAYRHLSFALRGCGQNIQADEAYRRAMKYETRAAPQSPDHHQQYQKNDISMIDTTTKNYTHHKNEVVIRPASPLQPLVSSMTTRNKANSTLQQMIDSNMKHLNNDVNDDGEYS
jgi:hypothetical protein